MTKTAKLFRLACLLFAFFVYKISTAQNSIIAQPLANDFRFEDLWNVTVNTDVSTTYETYFVKLRVFDNAKGLRLETNSKAFSVTNNLSVFNSANFSSLAPFEYTYSGSEVLENISRRGGLFPAGDYRFDYKLYGQNGSTQTELADYSMTHSVIMPAFLQLVTLFDKDSLQEENPTFMWLPASAMRTTGNIEDLKEYKLTYTLTIAEVYTNQTPYMAMTSNPKFFVREGLENTILTYPASARRFEKCKEYAWQVRGVINGQTVISSEIWTFYTPCEEEPPVIVPVLVKPTPDLAVCNVIDNTVSFAYYEEYHVDEGSILSARIYNHKGQLVTDEVQLNLPVTKGYNMFTFNTCPAGANLANGSIYTLIITNSKNEKWYLRIVNDQQANTCY